MARYIATMSVRQQEAFELEIAQKCERIDLQKAREVEAARRAQVKRDIEQRQTSLLTMDDKVDATFVTLQDGTDPTLASIPLVGRTNPDAISRICTFSASRPFKLKEFAG